MLPLLFIVDTSVEASEISEIEEKTSVSQLSDVQWLTNIGKLVGKMYLYIYFWV